MTISLAWSWVGSTESSLAWRTRTGMLGVSVYVHDDELGQSLLIPMRHFVRGRYSIHNC